MTFSVFMDEATVHNNGLVNRHYFDSYHTSEWLKHHVYTQIVKNFAFINPRFLETARRRSSKYCERKFSE